MSSSGSGMFLFLSFFSSLFCGGRSCGCGSWWSWSWSWLAGGGGAAAEGGWSAEDILFCVLLFFVSVYLGLMICGIFWIVLYGFVAAGCISEEA